MLSIKQVRLFATVVIVATAAWTSPAAAADDGYRPCTGPEYAAAFAAEDANCGQFDNPPAYWVCFTTDDPSCLVDEDTGQVVYIAGGCSILGYDCH